MELERVVSDFAAVLKAIDQLGPTEPGKPFKPGIGPLTEPTLIALATATLKETKPADYSKAGPRTYPRGRNECDIVIPTQWAIEIKLARPFGDNGRPAERWSENLLYPYPGNTSSIGDSLKLLESGFSEQKAVIVVGYEHSPPKVPLEPAVRAFEVVARHVAGIRLSSRTWRTIDGLVHPYHQQATVLGWEVLGRNSPSA